ncbi:Cytokine Receptor-Like Factor 2 [Manis pentadactyla]|nr:Cytokine Receptor-Like Factor 2 [Manis pentadactyla]
MLFSLWLVTNASALDFTLPFQTDLQLRQENCCFAGLENGSTEECLHRDRGQTACAELWRPYTIPAAPGTLQNKLAFQDGMMTNMDHVENGLCKVLYHLPPFFLRK